MWKTCLILSLMILVSAVVLFIWKRKKKSHDQLLSPFHTLFAMVFVAIMVGIFPAFRGFFPEKPFRLFNSFFLSLLETIQIFTVNIDGPDVLEIIRSESNPWSGVYSAYMTFLCIVAPLLTFGFLVTLLKNLMKDLTYLRRYCGDVYAFSALDMASMTLAEDIKSKHPKAVIVFAKVKEETTDIVGRAEDAGFLLFQKDLLSIKLDRHKKGTKLSLFTMTDNERDNLLLALQLVNKYKDRDNTEMYVRAAGSEGELLLSNVDRGKVKLRRVDEIRSLIYVLLYEEGEQLFKNAIPVSDQEKRITAAVVGLGRYGTEMMKALAWYCQMDGYSVVIHGFDKGKEVEDRFKASFPELMAKENNGTFIPGQGCYEIQIHDKVDVTSTEFSKSIRGMKDLTYVFVGLGSDEKNVAAAAQIRLLAERGGTHPVIQAVVYDEEETAVLRGLTNYSGQEYGIEPVGGRKTMYSEKVIISNELEQQALARHLKWGNEEEFWQYEYNYRSSMASALHLKAKLFCGIPGAEKTPEELTEEERDVIEALEHQRWNVYMRSEGYIYSGSTDKASRNNLAKMHHDLVPFETLTEEEKRKDSRAGTVG